MSLLELRKAYHEKICQEIIRVKSREGISYPNFADVASIASVHIASGIVNRFQCTVLNGELKEQTAGDLFEICTKEFLEASFNLLQHLRPGQWVYTTDQTEISRFDQYEHLASISDLIKNDKRLSAALGRDYIVRPDIVILRASVSKNDINQKGTILNTGDAAANLTPLIEENNPANPHYFLHASISCKWTIRSDRSQNTRTEALNLIRNRKGKLPHIVAVTAEPLPTRLAALALGTGDLDCVYHFALYELKEALAEANNQDQHKMFDMMVEGRRLRDISDLPFDLAI